MGIGPRLGQEGNEVMAEAPGQPSAHYLPTNPRPGARKYPAGQGASMREFAGTYGHAGNKITEKNSSQFKGVTKHRRSGR